MADLKNELQDIIENIGELTDSFYQQDNENGYLKLYTMLGDMTTVVDNLFLYNNNNKDLIFDDTKLIGGLTDAMNALEKKDTVLLADILQYDILEQFNQIVNQL